MKYIKVISAILILNFIAAGIQAQVLLESEGGLKLGTTTITGDGIFRFHNGEYQVWKNNTWQSLFSGNVGLPQ